jgi:hypothetical protein
MLLRRFSVTGYKNLRRTAVLDALGSINLIHGPNNVGKSNLLQAMALFFQCLLPTGGDLPIAEPRKLTPAETQDLVSHPREMFHLDEPAPILLSGSLDVPKDELEAAGIKPLYSTSPIEIDITLEWDGDDAAVRITRFLFGDGTDATKRAAVADEKTRVLRFAKFLARNMLVREGPDQRFAIIGVRRDLEHDMVHLGSGDVPLALEMYDCRESPDTVRRDRWRAFVRAMQEFQETTGAGVFEVTYQRAEARASLVFDAEKTRIPFRLLGTGVQQVAALLGSLLVRNASIVAIEEPELNLRWDLQNKLRDALRGLVTGPREPGSVSQLFLTSHSPAFEAGEQFFLVERGPDGPVVSRRPTSDLPFVLGTAAEHIGLPDRAAQAYVTSQGVMRLPPSAVERLRVQGGGGVVLVDAAPHGVRLVSNSDYLDELGPVEQPAPSDEP